MRLEGIVACKRRRFRRTTTRITCIRSRRMCSCGSLTSSLPTPAWVMDVTDVWTHQGWLYPRRDPRPVFATGCRLGREREQRSGGRGGRTRSSDIRENARAGLVHHSDRGSVYASKDDGEELEKIGAVKSMSRTGDGWDNAVAESFLRHHQGREDRPRG